MSGLLGMLSNFLPFQDGGAIPPSNAMRRVPWRPQGPKMPNPPYMPSLLRFFGTKPVPKKRGGAVKKKGKKNCGCK
jgi:hypothetical protein